MSRGTIRGVAGWTLAALRFYRSRTLLTVVAIALASWLAASAVGFFVGCGRALDASVASLGYHILVTGKGCPHEAATLMLRGGTIPMYIRAEVHDRIVAMAEVEDATRFLLQAASVGDDSTVQVFTGVDDAFLRLKTGIDFQRGGWFSHDAADEVILGFNVAEYRRLGIGDEMVVLGRRLVVRGILSRQGTQDDGTVFLPLVTAQSVFERGDRMTGIGLRLADPASAGDVIERIYDEPSVQVVRMAQVRSQLMRSLEGIRAVIGVFAGIAVLVAMLGVANAALLSVHERSAELGVLRGIGCSAPRLFALVWAETLAMALLGVGIGTAMTIVARVPVERFLRSAVGLVAPGHFIDVSCFVLVAVAVAVVGLCLLAAIHPSWKACRIPPMHSIRGPLS